MHRCIMHIRCFMLCMRGLKTGSARSLPEVARAPCPREAVRVPAASAAAAAVAASATAEAWCASRTGPSSAAASRRSPCAPRIGSSWRTAASAASPCTATPALHVRRRSPLSRRRRRVPGFRTARNPYGKRKPISYLSQDRAWKWKKNV